MNSPGAHPADAAFRILGKGIDQKSPPPLTTCSGSISGARRAGLRAGYRRPRRRLRRVVTHLLAQECRTEMPDSGIHFADGTVTDRLLDGWGFHDRNRQYYALRGHSR